MSDTYRMTWVSPPLPSPPQRHAIRPVSLILTFAGGVEILEASAGSIGS